MGMGRGDGCGGQEGDDGGEGLQRTDQNYVWLMVDAMVQLLMLMIALLNHCNSVSVPLPNGCNGTVTHANNSITKSMQSSFCASAGLIQWYSYSY